MYPANWLQSPLNTFIEEQSTRQELARMTFEVLTKTEAAERARISRRQLETQIRAGVGPAVTRIGGSVRIRSDELEAWLVGCTKPTASHMSARAE